MKLLREMVRADVACYLLNLLYTNCRLPWQIITEVADMEARPVTHAEVCFSALALCSSAADYLRLRSHESRLYHGCSENTGMSTAFFNRDKRGIVGDTIELLKEIHQDGSTFLLKLLSPRC